MQVLRRAVQRLAREVRHPGVDTELQPGGEGVGSLHVAARTEVPTGGALQDAGVAVREAEIRLRADGCDVRREGKAPAAVPRGGEEAEQVGVQLHGVTPGERAAPEAGIIPAVHACDGSFVAAAVRAHPVVGAAVPSVQGEPSPRCLQFEREHGTEAAAAVDAGTPAGRGAACAEAAHRACAEGHAGGDACVPGRGGLCCRRFLCRRRRTGDGLCRCQAVSLWLPGGRACLLRLPGGAFLVSCLLQPVSRLARGCRAGRGCLRGGDCQAHGHAVAAAGVVARDEAAFRQLPAHNQFGLHAAGAGPCEGEVCGFVPAGRAVAVYVQRHFPSEYFLPVPLHAVLKPCEFGGVAVVGDVEHVPVRHEAEGVDRVRLFLRRQGQQGKGEAHRP